MLSESAAVAPLRPVVGVCVSADCEPGGGTFRSECFCFESAAPASACDDDGGGTVVLVAKVPCAAASPC